MGLVLSFFLTDLRWDGQVREERNFASHTGSPKAKRVSVDPGMKNK